MEVTREFVVGAFKRAAARAVATPLEEGALAVEPVAAGGVAMVAVDAEGTWGLAIRSLSTSGHIPAIHLTALSAEFGIRCQLDFDGDVQRIKVSLVRCRTDDEALRGLFVTFVAALLSELPPRPPEQLLSDAIGRWISLFWRLQAPPRADVIGLIGELTVLYAADDASAWATAWHSSPRDLVDFGFTDPGLEIEVKATSGRERIHVLSIHQSNPPKIAERYFASLFVELRDSGVSLGETAQSIADRLVDAETRRRFWTVIAQACGEEAGPYLATRFVRDVSVESLQFFPARNVPAPTVDLPLPVGVSDLRFRSDFSSASPVPPHEILRRR